MVRTELPNAAQSPLLQRSIQLHLDGMRAQLEEAFCGIALETQHFVFRSLAEILITTPASNLTVEAFYHARQACHAYLSDLEGGPRSADKRLLALTSIDLLETTLLLSRVTNNGVVDNGLVCSPR